MIEPDDPSLDEPDPWPPPPDPGVFYDTYRQHMDGTPYPPYPSELLVYPYVPVFLPAADPNDPQDPTPPPPRLATVDGSMFAEWLAGSDDPAAAWPGKENDRYRVLTGTMTVAVTGPAVFDGRGVRIGWAGPPGGPMLRFPTPAGVRLQSVYFGVGTKPIDGAVDVVDCWTGTIPLPERGRPRF